MSRLGFLLFSFLFLSLTSQSEAGEIRVHAAASLTDALEEIASLYERKTDDKVLFNFGASSTLARQISEGAPGDIFFSADEEKMNQLQKEGLVVSETRRSVLSNRLVIVAPIDSSLRLRHPGDLDRASVRHIAIGEPSTVPAGIYARQYLVRVRLWSRLTPKIVPTENVRAALAAVESGNAEVGIVYKTDAMISKKVKTLFEISGKDAPEISYPVAVLKEAENRQGAVRFLSYLTSTAARAVFTKYGFLVRS